MATVITVEVYADITCPFTHVGLNRVVRQIQSLDRDIEIAVRAWPLEWVNGTAMEPGPVAEKITALEQQLDIDDFGPFRTEAWPGTTIPALNLAAQALAQSPSLGLTVSRALRAALFVEGRDISDDTVLAEIAAAHGLDAPGRDPDPLVLADYEEGQRRGVRGSPDFWIDGAEFFCPSLDLSRDEGGNLVAQFDPDGLDAFIAAATT